MMILVTGSTGMLGAAIVDELLSRGLQVRAMVEPGLDVGLLRRKGVEIAAADVLDAPAVLAAADGCCNIVHAAAVVSYWPRRSKRTARVNVDGTLNVVRAAIKTRVRGMLLVGSASSFGPGSIEVPGDEATSYKAGKYGASYFDSKLAAQEATLSAAYTGGLHVVVVNPTFMIGPYASDQGSASLVLRLLRRQVPIVPPGGRNFVYTRDVAVGVANALDRGRNGECYILGGENLTYETAFLRICSVLGVESPSRKIPPLALRMLGRAQSGLSAVTRRPPAVSATLARMLCDDCYYSSEKARRELALPATPIETAVEEAYVWYLESGFSTSAAERTGRTTLRSPQSLESR